ncbi:MAG: hypothetical protein ABIY55_27365 [Kofleriaceae bacterium]
MSLSEIRAALALGDPAFALAELRASLDAVEQRGRAELAEWLALLARAGQMLGGPSFVEAVRGALDDPDDPAALAVLAVRLQHEHLPRMASTLLARAHRFAPTDDTILAQLITALAADGQHARASAVLRDAPAPGGASLGRRGAQACHALIAGNLDEPRACWPELSHSAEPAHRALAAVIGGMLARADAIAPVAPLDGRDLRGWHFVITGGFLLRLAAPGRGAGMNGRYAFVHDAYADCLAGVRRAARVLSAIGQPVERVLVIDDRASAILGRAAAQAIGCRVVAWSPAARGLVAVYDLAELAPAWRAELRDHRPGQAVLGHAASWTEEPPFAPDLVTRLHQYSRAPWDSHTGVDPATGAPCEVAADDAGVATLAARIAGAPVVEDEAADLAALLAIVEASRAIGGDAVAGALRSAGPRRRAWCGSPVQSLRFG